ncbi:homoserine kinase [Jatrophihabitans sp. GAS493]|nr:homoserine kinase [Jatrophihabitans sp. GAS493]
MAQVRVPATSANLGPGFDTLGLALGLFDDVMARVADSGLAIDVAGEGEESVALDESHLVVRAMRATFERLGGQPPGLELVCANRIPHGRGLGSSSAAIVAGVLLARGLVLGGETTLTQLDALQLASEIEGHPDNVAPCLLGGFTVAWTDGEQTDGEQTDGEQSVHALKLAVAPEISPIVLIPPYESSTAQVRRLLPAQVPFSDAVFNSARSALLVAALTGATSSLLEATADRLHQPYRAEAMAESAELVAALREHGVPTVISGAGPTVLALARNTAEFELVTSMQPAKWRCEHLPVHAEPAGLLRPSPGR